MFSMDNDQLHALDDDDDESLCSAMSHDSDFQDDEDADYLALELVNHLPADISDKLMRSMRSKEKALQDLLRRNQKLLGSCQELDEENQSLEGRLKDAETKCSEVQPEASKAAAPKAAAAATVDTSVWDRMQQGKDESIGVLKQENQRLAVQVRRLDEHGRRLDEALQQSQKEVKRLAKQRAPAPSQLPRGDVDEEDQLYQRMQQAAAGDLIVQRFQQKQHEQQLQLQKALHALLKEDMNWISAWGSDVAALLMAVEGMESRVKVEPKGRAKASSKKKSAPHAAASAPGTEKILEASTELQDDFEKLQDCIEKAEGAQKNLEQTVGGWRGGADTCVADLLVESDLTTAEREAEWIREHNAAWVERVRTLSLVSVVDLLESSEEAMRSMLDGAPPGLIPQQVERCITDTCGQISLLSKSINDQSTALNELQESSVTLGRRVKTLQAAQKAHRQAIQNRVTEEITRAASAAEQPLSVSRASLRKQGEVVDCVKKRILGTLEELSDTVRKALTNIAEAAPAPAPVSSEGMPESFVQEVRSLRSMGNALAGSLTEGGSAMETRMQQVLAAVMGDAQKPKAKAPALPPGAAKASVEASQQPKESTLSKNQRRKAKKAAEKEAAATTEGADPGPKDEDSQMRAELLQAFDSPSSKEKAKAAKAVARVAAQEPDQVQPKPEPPEDKTPSRSGPELLQELKALKQGADALEERMSARMAARQGPAEDAPEEEDAEVKAAEPVKSAPARRKKRYD